MKRPVCSSRPSPDSQLLRRTRSIAMTALGLLLAAATPALAQETGTLQGTVVDATTQRPVADVQVLVVGTRLGGRTGDYGRFTVTNVPAGLQTVRAARIGYAPMQQQVSVTAGSTAEISFAMTPAAISLEGQVVTGLGIERDQRTISTSVQTVDGDQLTEARDPNLVAALSGKVAGVQISNSNTPGGSSRVVIRGANSLTGNNQPLFVVDGIPVSNASAKSDRDRGYNAIDYGNVIQDINPNDIENISVLKGPNAAAIYGSRGANGAILITTKSGRSARGAQINATSNVTYETPLKLPTYQNSYGQGWNGAFSYVNGRGGGTNDDYDESWGPRLDGRLLPQFNSPVDPVTGVREPTPWVAHPNNVRDFFETGRTVNTGASVAASSDRANVRLSVSRMDADGMLPGFEMDRTNAALHGGTNLTDRLRTDASVQYIKSGAVNRPSQGYGGNNPMWQFLWFGRQVDTRALRERTRNPDGTQYNWNNIWNNNPYFTAFENRNEDGRDRIIGNASLTYDITSWLNGTVRSGTDWYEENRREQYAAGNYSVTSVDANGALGVTNVYRNETNTDFLLQATVPRTGDFGVLVDFGGNRRDETFRSNGIYIRNLAVPGVYSYSNYTDAPTPSDNREKRAVNSLYAQARLSYRDFVFVDASGRNDWSSTLPSENNSYFYPGVSASVVFSELVALPALSFGRIRGGWAQVGNDAPPYQLVNPYLFDVPFGTAPRLSASNALRNRNLKPERTASTEIGADLRFLDDRIGIGGTYYDKATTDQIVDLQVSAMTGFTSRVVNAGRISNHGMELMVDATPVKLANGFEWNVMANYSRDRAFVNEIYGDLNSIVLGTYYNVTVEARKGERYGAMYGRKYVRDSEGNIVVGSNGLPLNASTNPVGYLGNYNPDWIAGLTNRLSYRGFDVSALLDIRQGGNIYSLTNFYGRRSGVLIETLQGRENTPLDSLIVPGVVVVAGDTVPNTRKVTAQAYHRSLGNGLAEQFTFDASFMKLRELRVGYDVPSNFAGRMGLSAMRVALVGRNLWLKSDVPHIDPETGFDASNVQGFEYSQMPSAKSIGFNLSVTP